ncbi:DUF4440 domain-containing protein [Pseudomonas vancouverensis]|uniref:nuclear transport factor 2 family protein n=1 Tax=Pseudomonas vancouverensis TaxID=95300 RepID=UPI003D05EBA5
MDLSQTLLHLEQSLLTQSTRCNAEEVSHLLADDFIEFGASGMIWSKAEVLEQLPQEIFTPRTITRFTTKRLSECTVLVTYHCHSATNNSLRSSIWRKQDEQWQMFFHQGTISSIA